MQMLAAVLALAAASMAPSARHSVTFLLGNDRAEAGFFTGAASYYRSHADQGEEIVPARSLEDVREYLARHADRDGAAWSTIRLVAHGSEWYGLLVPVFNDQDGDATLAKLEGAASSGEFPPLSTSAYDDHTRLVIESCGIARRPDFERAIAQLFFGSDPRPRVEASRDYVAFRMSLDALGHEIAERTELPYAAIVTREGVHGEADRARLRNSLEQRWLEETGHAPSADLVMRDIPVEIRQPVSTASVTTRRVDTPRADLLSALRDRGLRHDQLRWTRENTMQVGRAHIVTLAPVAEDWVLTTGP